MKVEIIFQFSDLFKCEIEGKARELPVLCQQRLALEMPPDMAKAKEAMSRLVIDNMSHIIDQLKEDFEQRTAKAKSDFVDQHKLDVKSRLLTVDGNTLKSYLPKEPDVNKA